MSLPSPGSEVSDDYFPSEVEVVAKPSPPPPTPQASSSSTHDSASNQNKSRHSTTTTNSTSSNITHSSSAPRNLSNHEVQLEEPTRNHTAQGPDTHSPAPTPVEERHQSRGDATDAGVGSATQAQACTPFCEQCKTSGDCIVEPVGSHRGGSSAEITPRMASEAVHQEDVGAPDQASPSPLATPLPSSPSRGGGDTDSSFALLDDITRVLSFLWDYKLHAMATAATRYIEECSVYAIELVESSQAFFADPPPLAQTVERVKGAATGSFQFESMLVLALLLCMVGSRLMSLRFIKYERALDDEAKKQNAAAHRSGRRSASPQSATIMADNSSSGVLET
jgi:hypothetical protein